MDTKLLLEYTMIAEVVVSLACFVFLCVRRALGEYRYLGAFLLVHALNETVATGIMYFRANLGLDRRIALSVLVYSRWVSSFVEFVLLVWVIYGVYHLALASFPGLQRAGDMVFRWFGGIAVAMSICFAIGPHMLSDFVNMTSIYATRISQGINVMMLCLLSFVCVAIKPLGLTYRSRVFGVCLGLGVVSTTSLVASAWLSTMGAQTVYSPVFLVSGLGILCGLTVWSFYFALPEPKAALVLLPTTSPYFFWNRICEAFGDKPGHVVVGGFRPEMLAPGEVQILKAMSRATRDRQRDAEERMTTMNLSSLKISDAGMMAGDR